MMRHLSRAGVVALVLVSSLAGCRSQSTTSYGDKIAVGMQTEEALAILRRSGLDPQETVLAWERYDGKPFDHHLLEPTAGTDALLLMMIHDDKRDTQVVDSIDWYLNWVHEAHLPQVKRKYEFEEVDRISIEQIKQRLHDPSRR